MQIVALAEWEAHLRVIRRLGELEALLVERDALEQRHRAALDENNQHLASVVRELREIATWQEIGDQLGVTRQAAYDRLNRYVLGGQESDQ